MYLRGWCTCVRLCVGLSLCGCVWACVSVNLCVFVSLYVRVVCEFILCVPLR